MKTFKCGLLHFFVVLVGIVVSGAALAQESILSYDSRVEMERSGDLTVTETITVKAEGDKIQRGIYRDFPTLVRGDGGRAHEVDFTILSVERDGKPEPYEADYSGHGVVRVYIGDKDVILEPGQYSYTLSYATDRQIRFFEDHEELFWNVTGNFWAFPIEKARAEIHFPEGVSAEKWTAYTGARGARGKDWSGDARNGVVTVATTKPLPPGDGLSVVVAMPKGAIDPPSAEQERRWFIRDNLGTIIGGVGLLIVCLYYFAAWMCVGRDPASGTIIPLYEPPSDISPALASYIHYRGMRRNGWQALSAALVSLGVKQRLVLAELDSGDVELQPTGKESGLPKGEAAIMAATYGQPFLIGEDNKSAVQRMLKSFISAIEDENRGKFFKTNRIFSVVGVALSVLTVFFLVSVGMAANDDIAILVPLIMFAVVVAIVSVNIGKTFIHSRSILKRLGAVFALFPVGMAIMFFIFSAPVEINPFESVPIPSAIIAALFGVNVLFYFLIGAPTAMGRKVMDQIDGLELYLSVAEKERMNAAGAPQMSPSHFETLLPYAVALGVEKPWSNAFEKWLTSAAAAAVVGGAYHYSPHWRSGSDFDGGSIGRSVSASLDNVSSALSASMPSSSSSGFSGGGGGGSGGGGGGGGGGGW